MKRRQWIISLVLTVLLIGLAAFAFQKMKSQKESTVSDAKEIKEEIRKINTSQFEKQNIKSSIAIDGRLNAYEKVDLFSEVTGRLLDGSGRYREGSYFSEGDILFQIDNRDDQFNLYAQRSTLLNSITQIMPDMKFDYPESFQKWKSYLDQFNVEQSVRPLPTVSNEKEKYYISGKNIYNQYYTIKSMEDRMSNYSISAPFSGVFLTVNKFPGSLVSPGAPLGRIMNTSQFELVATVGMSDLKYVKSGQRVELYSDELGKKWKGTVNRIAKQIDQSTQSIPIYINVQGNGLRDGVFLKGNLSGSNLSDVNRIPKNILSGDNEIFVFRDSTISKKEIEVISIEENDLIVKGIDPTDQVVVSSINNLYDGQKVILEN